MMHDVAKVKAIVPDAVREGTCEKEGGAMSKRWPASLEGLQ